MACQNGHTEIVKLLIEVKGIDLNKGAKGTSPLQKSKQKNHHEIAKLLLDAGAEDSLHDAVSLNDMKIVEKCLNRDGMDVNKMDEKGRTSLYIACEKSHTEIVQHLLLVEGIDENQSPTKWMHTTLHCMRIWSPGDCTISSSKERD